MRTLKLRTTLWLSGLSLVALTITALLMNGAALGDEQKTEPALTSTPPEVNAIPPGTSLPTAHEGILVPAAPEDPAAPAVTYRDPPPAPEGCESANRPIPDYLKGSPYRLSFVTGDYSPPADERIDPRLIDGLGRNARGYTYGYVMFEGEVQARKVTALEQLGVVFGTPQTFNAMQAWIPEKAIAGLRVSPFVRWVGYARPEQKVDSFILEKLMQPGADPTEEIAVYVNTFEGDLGPASRPVPIDAVAPPVSNDPKEIEMRATVMMSNGPFQRAIEAAGGRVMGYADSIQTFYVWATRPVIRRLMQLDFVAGMDSAFPPEPDHDRSMRMTEATYMGAQTSYNGKDVSVAIVDSGIHHSHHDLSQTWMIGWDYSGEGNSGVDDLGHGTHVSGTVFGDGSARTDRRFRGSAPMTGTEESHPIFRVKILTKYNTYGPNWPNYGITAWDRTTTSHTMPGGTAQPCTVVQNSWGSGGRLSTGYYGTDTLSRGCDSNTYDHQQLYVMSSGNKGGSSTTIYFRSNRPPAVAKSAFTGGSVLDYDDTAGGMGNRYPGAHRFSSSKGPTRDGRFKPQISAPGCYVVSCRTNSTTLYSSYEGTSMAAPHVSGIAVMMHDGNSTYRTYPCLCRAKMMAAAAPYNNTRTWSSSSESYYNRRGMGLVDAYATILARNSAGGWIGGYSARTITRSSSGFYFDITVPTDATRTFFVMSWDEKPAALNATKSLLYNFDLIVDVAPFDPDITKGDYTSTNTTDNYDWIGHTGALATALRGKQIRIKVPFVTRPTSTTESLRVAVAYHIARGDATPAVTTSLTASPTKVRPGSVITVTGTADVPAYRANNVYMELDPGSATITTLEHTTRDGRTLDTHTVVGTTDSVRNWTVGEASHFWSASHRSLVWTLQAPSSNGTFWVRATTRGDNCSTSTDARSICVDGLSPTTPGKISSSTHTPNVWSNVQAFTASWIHAKDSGCAGLAGYGGGAASSCLKILSANLGLTTLYSTKFPASANGRWYFAIKSFDAVGNSSATTCVGPYLIDTVAPSSGTISINAGAATTTTLTVTLGSLGATESGSGLYRMRFSNSGSTWSPWESYSSTHTSWDLSAYGGNTSAGTKRVYVQYRDRAGNASGSYSDTITYSPLTITVTGVSPDRGTLIGGDKVTVSGSGFAAGAQVYFGTAAATAVSVVSSTQITCRTPRHLTWEPVDVRVSVGTISGTKRSAYEYVGGRILATGHPKLATPFGITFDAPVDGGKTYVAAVSLGAGPIPLAPHNPLMVSPDMLFFLTLQNLIPSIFGGLQGTLNGSGRANGSILIPDISALVGLPFHMAFVTVDGTKPLGIRTVSSGREFKIQPKS